MSGAEIGALDRSVSILEKGKVNMVEGIQRSQDSEAGLESARRVLESAGEGIIVLDSEGRVNFSNEQAAILINRKGENLGGSLFSSFFSMDSRDRLRFALGRVVNEGVIEPAIELILRPVIEQGASHLLASAARLAGAKELGMVLTLRDWTGVRRQMDLMRERIEELSETLGELGVEHIQLWENSEKLESMAIYDDLTKLYNRRYFSLRGKEEFARALRHKGALGVLMLDLDHFKRVNDEMGHLFGDAVLQQSGALIRQTVRVTDIAVRYGGEEFLILAPETAGTGLEVLAERLRLAFEKHEYAYEEISRRVTVSVGGTSIPPYRFESMERLVAEADKALYEAKGNRNRAVCKQVGHG